MKKTTILIAGCLLILCITSGCTIQTTKTNHDTSTESTSAAVTTTGETGKRSIDVSQIRLVFSPETQKVLFNSTYRISGCPFFGNLVFTEVYTKKAEAVGKYFGYFDLTKQTRTELGQIEGLQVSSGDSVVMHKTSCYTCWSRGSAGNTGYQNSDVDNLLIKLDASSNTMKILKEDKNAFSPFIYFSKLNEDEFLMLGMSSSGNQSFSTVKKYDTRTESSSVLIQESYKNDNVMKNSTGRLIEAISCCDGKIYALGRQKVNTAYKFQLLCYAEDGTLQSSIDAQAVEDFIGNNNLLDFHMVGNYFTLEVYGMAIGKQIFHVDGQTITPLLAQDEGRNIAVNSYSQQKNPFIFYYSVPQPQKGQDESKLMVNEFSVLDTRTGAITVCRNNFDAKHPSLDTMTCDENGNLLLTVEPSLYTKNDPQTYYVPRSAYDAIK